jgi:DNA repair protein RadC
MHRQQVSSGRIKNMRAHLEQQLQMRRTELTQLKKVGQNKGADEKNLVFMQQQVISAGKRQQQLHELQNKREALERDLQAKQAEDII